MDTILSLLDSMLQYTVPILIAAIGGFYSEKSGVVNIALDGFVIFGSFVASFIALTAFGGAPTMVQLVICLRWNNWRTRLINMLPKLSPRTERRWEPMRIAKTIVFT